MYKVQLKVDIGIGDAGRFEGFLTNNSRADELGSEIDALRFETVEAAMRRVLNGDGVEQLVEVRIVHCGSGDQPVRLNITDVLNIESHAQDILNAHGRRSLRVCNIEAANHLIKQIWNLTYNLNAMLVEEDHRV